MKTPAILLIVVGIAIVIWGAFGFQTREKVLDVGSVVLEVGFSLALASGA